MNPEGNPSFGPPGEVPAAPIIARGGAPYGEKPCAGGAMPGNPPGTGRAPAAAAAAAASAGAGAGAAAGFLSPSFSAPSSPGVFFSGSGFLKSPFTSSFELGFTMRIALLLRCCTTGGPAAGFIGTPAGGMLGPGDSRTGAPPGPPNGEPGPPIAPMPPMPPMRISGPGTKPAGMPPGPMPPGKPYGMPLGGMPPGRPPITGGPMPPGTPPKGNAGAPLGICPGWPPGAPPNCGAPSARADPPESRGPGGGSSARRPHRGGRGCAGGGRRAVKWWGSKGGPR